MLDFTSGQDKVSVLQPGLSYNAFGSVFASYADAVTRALTEIKPNVAFAAQVGGDLYLFIDAAGDGGTYETVVKLVGVTYATFTAADLA